MVIWVPVMLLQNVVLFRLPSQLVLLAMALQVLDEVAPGVGQLSEQDFQILSRDVEIVLESLKELVMGSLIRLSVTRLLLALDLSVAMEVGLNSKSL